MHHLWAPQVRCCGQAAKKRRADARTAPSRRQRHEYSLYWRTLSKERSMNIRRRNLLQLAATAASLAALGLSTLLSAAEPHKGLRIGIVGSGNVGGTLGTLWVKAGHEVMFSS